MLELHRDDVALQGGDPDRQDTLPGLLLEQDHSPESELGISSVSIRGPFHFLVHGGAGHDIGMITSIMANPCSLACFGAIERLVMSDSLSRARALWRTRFQRTDRRSAVRIAISARVNPRR